MGSDLPNCMPLQAFVGFTLSNILSSCHSWRYTRRSQRWSLTAAAVEVLYTALTTPLGARQSSDQEHSSRGDQADWSLAQAVAEAVSRPGGPAGYLFGNLPPHAGDAFHLCRLLKGSGPRPASNSCTGLSRAVVEVLSRAERPAGGLSDFGGRFK